MKYSRYITLFKWLFASSLVTLSIITLCIYVYVDNLVQKGFYENRYENPTEYYGHLAHLNTGQSIELTELVSYMKSQNYSQQPWGLQLNENEFSVGEPQHCQSLRPDIFTCLATYLETSETRSIVILGVDELQTLVSISQTNLATGQSTQVNSLEFLPVLLGQYIEIKSRQTVQNIPIIQSSVPMSDIPRYCLDALLAIEDPTFLEHKGVSIRGFLRALWINLKTMSYSQGGSTITQQLIKNHFLSADKHLVRKIKEMIIAFVLELKVPKDEILNQYLNIIYWGSDGSYQVRGIQAASNHYFNKDVKKLNLSECALVTAIINSPGRFNPFRKNPEPALSRRQKILQKMLDQNRISQEEFASALQAPLPTSKKFKIKKTAPYFIDTVKSSLSKIGLTDLRGLKVFTSLIITDQAEAQKSVRKHLEDIEKNSKYHQENRNHNLQALFAHVDTRTGYIKSLVGGRDYKSAPFNRFLNGKRQVGSLFKPFVYLTGFLIDPDFTPLSPLDNSPLNYKFGKQTWSPKNYDKKYSAPVPAFYALKESMNLPTARLALSLGLENIIQTARLLGIKAELKPYPALSLGAFEVPAIELLQAYTTLARRGSYLPVRSFIKVTNQEGDLIYDNSAEPKQILNATNVSLVTHMLKETTRTGTAKSVRRVLSHEYSGKTGTTSNERDAWFVGFNDNQVALSWIGYDDGLPLKKTGASGALPIWLNFMRQQALPASGTASAPDTEAQTFSAEELLEMNIPENKAVETSVLLKK